MALFDKDRSEGVNVQDRLIEDLVRGAKGVVIKLSSLETLVKAMKAAIADFQWSYNVAVTLNPSHFDDELIDVCCQVCDEDSIVYADILIGHDGLEIKIEVSILVVFVMENRNRLS